MSKTVNFNKNASILIAANDKVRVRQIELNGELELQVKPTNRVAGKDLEMLRTKSGPTPTRRLVLSDELVGSMTCFTFEARKHGWFALVPCEAQVRAVGQAAPAGGSIAAR